MNVNSLSRRSARCGPRTVLGCLVRLCTLAIVLVLFSGERAQAATFIWDGGGSNTNDWSGNTQAERNWNTNTAPANNGTADLQFAGSARPSPNMNVSYNVNSITFNSGATSFTLGNSTGTTLTIQGGGIVNNDDSLQTINISAISLGASQTWNAASGNLSLSGTINNAGFLLTVAGANNTAISGVISGSGGLTKTGAGTLTLSGASTYSGGTTISGGTVAVGNNAALGTGTLKFQGGSGTLMSASSTGYTLANLVEMHQDTTIGGTGALNFSGNFILKNNNHLLTIDNSAVTTFSGASITTDSNRTLTVNVNSASGGAVVSGVMQDSGANVFSLTKSGGGTLTLSGNNTYTGRTTVSGGTLLLAAANRIADTSPMTLSGGTFNTAGFSETVGALTLSANSVIDLGFSSGVLRFAASNGLFTSGTTLSIYNWTSGSDHLFFGTNNSSLDGSQLGQISFYSDSGGNFLGTGTFTGTEGELVPIPEPTAVVVALGVLGLIGWRERRRMRPGFEPVRGAIG